MKNTFFSAFILLCLLVLPACSRFTQIQKNPDTELRYKAAMEYYEKGDYYRANLLFEDLIPNLIGRARAEDVQFYYAYTQFKQRQYTLSAHYFKSFFDTYRRSERAEEAIYMHAYSKYLGTPSYNLDQSGTEEAIVALQDVINLYPDGDYAQKAFEYISALRSRLEKKWFEIATKYLRLRMYKAAVVALDNFRKDFPDSQMKEEVSYKRLEAQHELAKVSVQSLKLARYQQLSDDYLRFIDRYKTSAYLKKAESIYAAAQKAMQDL